MHPSIRCRWLCCGMPQCQVVLFISHRTAERECCCIDEWPWFCSATVLSRNEEFSDGRKGFAASELPTCGFSPQLDSSKKKEKKKQDILIWHWPSHATHTRYSYVMLCCFFFVYLYDSHKVQQLLHVIGAPCKLFLTKHLLPFYLTPLQPVQRDQRFMVEAPAKLRFATLICFTDAVLVSLTSMY